MATATATRPTGRPALGATPAEVSSTPGLLIDLSLSLIPRRLALCKGLCALLGDGALEKTYTRFAAAQDACDRLTVGRTAGAVPFDVAQYLEQMRLAATAVSEWEAAVNSLIRARVKVAIRALNNPESDQ